MKNPKKWSAQQRRSNYRKVLQAEHRRIFCNYRRAKYRARKYQSPLMFAAYKEIERVREETRAEVQGHLFGSVAMGQNRLMGLAAILKAEGTFSSWHDRRAGSSEAQLQSRGR